MKFNPITNKLYTDDGKLIKQMYCPYVDLKWNDLASMDNSLNRFCAICESSVVETKDFGDDALWNLLQEKPDTCLKVDMNQKNIRIINHV